ncbi:hypothetical protein [Paenibacillus sp. FSL R7-0337]|uniref:hypothetical protein n=1 Tax=Paenibacillus sp. FSL R7-0337 TaxID=1926588 RepID=UPI00096F40C4|nr:hypothetical protein [Paenibacillus sp. FSL R7-0337]OMF88744.1 hypothetical protein BK147_26430 [Paenibacillus sp. FSL R7-0337]
MKMLLSIGVERIDCSDWELIQSVIIMLHDNNEEFLSFRSMNGKTVVTDGNDEEVLFTIDKLIFSEKVWAVYGEDGEEKFFTFMLPNEY